MNQPEFNSEQSGFNHEIFQNCYNRFEHGYETQNHFQNYFVDTNQVNFDSYSSVRNNNFINASTDWVTSNGPNYMYDLYPDQSYQPYPNSTTNVSVSQESERNGSWSTSSNGLIEERLDDAIGVLQKHAESCNYSPQIDCHMPNFSNVGQSSTIYKESSGVQPHGSNSKEEERNKPIKAIRKKKTNRKKEPNNNKKSASGYAHFFRERQARIKEENKSASFGEISKIVASEWDALSIDEKAVYKRKAENAKSDQFKDIALSHAMAVAGANVIAHLQQVKQDFPL